MPYCIVTYVGQCSSSKIHYQSIYPHTRFMVVSERSYLAPRLTAPPAGAPPEPSGVKLRYGADAARVRPKHRGGGLWCHVLSLTHWLTGMGRDLVRCNASAYNIVTVVHSTHVIMVTFSIQVICCSSRFIMLRLSIEICARLLPCMVLC